MEDDILDSPRLPRLTTFHLQHWESFRLADVVVRLQESGEKKIFEILPIHRLVLCPQSNYWLKKLSNNALHKLALADKSASKLSGKKRKTSEYAIPRGDKSRMKQEPHYIHDPRSVLPVMTEVLKEGRHLHIAKWTLYSAYHGEVVCVQEPREFAEMAAQAYDWSMPHLVTTCMTKLTKWVQTSARQGKQLKGLAGVMKFLPDQLLTDTKPGKIFMTMVHNYISAVFRSPAEILLDENRRQAFCCLPLSLVEWWAKSGTTYKDSENTVLALLSIWAGQNIPDIAWATDPYNPYKTDKRTILALQARLSKLVDRNRLTLGYRTQVLPHLPWFNPAAKDLIGMDQTLHSMLQAAATRPDMQGLVFAGAARSSTGSHAPCMLIYEIPAPKLNEALQATGNQVIVLQPALISSPEPLCSGYEMCVDVMVMGDGRSLVARICPRITSKLLALMPQQRSQVPEQLCAIVNVSVIAPQPGGNVDTVAAAYEARAARQAAGNSIAHELSNVDASLFPEDEEEEVSDSEQPSDEEYYESEYDSDDGKENRGQGQVQQKDKDQHLQVRQQNPGAGVLQQVINAPHGQSYVNAGANVVPNATWGSVDPNILAFELLRVASKQHVAQLAQYDSLTSPGHKAFRFAITLSSLL